MPKLRKYLGDVTTGHLHASHRGRIVTVKAKSAQEALSLIKKEMQKDEQVYQIRRKFNDCSLPQPVYDYLNGFMLTGNEATVENWQDR